MGLRGWKLMLLIAGVNVLTQTGLNVGLNLIRADVDYTMYLAALVLLELGVFLVEAVLYLIFAGKLSKKKLSTGRIIGYAAAANGVSLTFGFLLPELIPALAKFL